jgi:hypothetical protein
VARSRVAPVTLQSYAKLEAYRDSRRIYQYSSSQILHSPDLFRPTAPAHTHSAFPDFGEGNPFESTEPHSPVYWYSAA